MLSLTGFSAASLLSLHLHVLPSGRVVAHSHPLPGKDSERSHDHSQQEYMALDAAARIFNSGDVFSADGLIFVADCHVLTQTNDQSSPSFTLLLYETGRAPPVSPRT